jgi:hypothetical protein
MLTDTENVRFWETIRSYVPTVKMARRTQTGSRAS